MRTEKAGATLFLGEQRLLSAGVLGLRYLRRGQDDQPLVVFLPGAAHLARIAYGDPTSSRMDFLDHWLETRGIGLAALSYPSDHPAIDAPMPTLTIDAWARWIATVVAEVLQNTPNRCVVVVMWSMAGRSAAAVNGTLKKHGINAICFISLAATPPLSGLIPTTPGGEALTPDGLWARTVASAPDGIQDRLTQGFLSSLADQRQRDGHRSLDEEVYLRDYLCNTPIMLRGSPQRYNELGVIWDREAAEVDMAATQFSQFPLTAMIVPTDRSDEGHALGDQAAWSFINAQMIRTIAAELGTEQWEKLRALVRELPQRLYREVPGGHFFFVGRSGAEATADRITRLIIEARQLHSEIDLILEGSRGAKAISAFGEIAGDTK
ncbi:hypothetical protein H8A95_24390 [Bradyrhizobium sp. Pear76]|uniref:hypothetical protein n=1 Tax=Bradyrhizobium oropedii TaxID=1571201 RepID=UPI001E51B648|nr:hypothetical protein [Bradyrhizobium oropedii]MCC8965369.1 hypothetical protein [Bradyrhizobium oropedii]